MNNKKYLFTRYIFLLLVFFFASVSADVIDQRLKDEQEMRNNPFLILPYEPTYFLPYYYTDKPYYGVYNNNTPDNQTVSNTDVKFQFSFKVPVWRDLGRPQNNFYFAYTQLSYWQAYDDSAFFRETDYEPELFYSYFWDKNLGKDWTWKFWDVGAVHQSNGRGGIYERSWNRLYTRVTLAHNQWAVILEPWYIIQDSTMKNHNPDIARYLGYGQSIIAYKYYRQTFSLSLQNEVESHFQRGAEMLTWSFPLTTHLKGYVQLLSGYGQSLIEYNHFTNSVGLGVALNDWV